jgi:hypothetical protein
MMYRILFFLMIGLVCFWGLPGCGDEKPGVIEEEVVMSEDEEIGEEDVVAEEVQAGSEETDLEEVPSGNTPPAITKVRILPSPAYTNTELQVEIEAEDADGDVIEYAYQWAVIKAGGTIEDAEELDEETGPTLSHSLFARDDAVAVKVTPSDMYSEGETLGSKFIMIANAAPSIVSSPPGVAADVYTYQVEAEDLDDDTLRYSVRDGGPAGMSIDAETGLLTWEISAADAGSYEVMIQAHDGHGASGYQRFTLTVGVASGTEESGAQEAEGSGETRE